VRVTVALVLSVLAIAGAVLYASESQRNVAEENYHEAIVARQLATDMLARENSLHEFLATGEARTLASLDHPNLPRYVEHFEEEGALYLVMEKIEGESVAALRRRRRAFSADEVMRPDIHALVLEARRQNVIPLLCRRPDDLAALMGASDELPALLAEARAAGFRGLAAATELRRALEALLSSGIRARA